MGWLSDALGLGGQKAAQLGFGLCETLLVARHAWEAGKGSARELLITAERFGCLPNDWDCEDRKQIRLAWEFQFFRAYAVLAAIQALGPRRARWPAVQAAFLASAEQHFAGTRRLETFRVRCGVFDELWAALPDTTTRLTERKALADRVRANLASSVRAELASTTSNVTAPSNPATTAQLAAAERAMEFYQAASCDLVARMRVGQLPRHAVGDEFFGGIAANTFLKSAGLDFLATNMATKAFVVKLLSMQLGLVEDVLLRLEPEL